jgi:hypothetical protein
VAVAFVDGTLCGVADVPKPTDGWVLSYERSGSQWTTAARSGAKLALLEQATLGLEEKRLRVRLLDAATLATLAVLPFESERPAVELSLESAMVLSVSAQEWEGRVDLSTNTWKEAYSIRVAPSAPPTARAMVLRALVQGQMAPVTGSFDGRLRASIGGLDFDLPGSDTVALVGVGQMVVATASATRATVMRVADRKIIGEFWPARVGAVAFLEGGVVDLRDHVAPEELGCLRGDVLLPWASCEKRFHVPGALDRAMEGRRDYLVEPAAKQGAD